MKLTAMLQMYNSMKFGNLRRYMESASIFCDAVVVYDDASTDNSVEYLEDEVKNWPIDFQVEIIRGEKNDYKAEVAHKAKLLKLAIDIGSDWIFRYDDDEVIEKRGEDGRIRELCRIGDETGVDAWAFRNANLWRHPAYYRLDNSFNDFVSCRLWKNNGKLNYSNIKRGLHQRAVPDGISKEKWADIITLHYGFASDEAILHKYHMYRDHGQRGWELHRLIDERTLRLAKSNPNWFRSPPDYNDGENKIKTMKPLVALV